MKSKPYELLLSILVPSIRSAPVNSPTDTLPFDPPGPADVWVRTCVDAPFARVVSGFGAPLFDTLNPPFPRARLIAMEGNRVGDRIELQLDFGLLRQDWTGVIIREGMLEGECWFVDRGERLPFFLRQWQHLHLMQANGPQQTYITDAIRFTPAPWIPRFIMRGMLTFLMRYRSPRYKKYFVIC